METTSTAFPCSFMICNKSVTVHRQAFSELKMPYDTVVAADFADLECEASAKSVTGTRYE
ncbi:hypothetical protein GMD50_13835 [Roseburia intestinalis]|uniref:Uncharacterized protein n=2 Tax=Roseburia intestinalis TaxID=166486 RepID=A0A6L6L9T8_9FIRM|nr:hypothetical protein [Roseburia intestinalis]MTR86102.1 hypothetical protein [Roseburia intestinalis]RHM02432.1 hypothetical protein DWZ87_15670 [Roseburia intestinalis]